MNIKHVSLKKSMLEHPAPDGANQRCAAKPYMAVERGGGAPANPRSPSHIGLGKQNESIDVLCFQNAVPDLSVRNRIAARIATRQQSQNGGGSRLGGLNQFCYFFKKNLHPAAVMKIALQMKAMLGLLKLQSHMHRFPGLPLLQPLQLLKLAGFNAQSKKLSVGHV